jgi:tripartite-type tricarboxylate transporter receptor subunit TctC
MLMADTGVALNHVPYRGPAPATQDVLAGQVPCGFLASPVVGPHVRAGKLIALAVSGNKRTASLPQVPTMAEAGVAGYDASFFEIVAAPRGTPPAAIERLQSEIAKALNDPKAKETLAAADLEVLASTPAQAAQQMRADFQKWGKVNEKVRLQLD